MGLRIEDAVLSVLDCCEIVGGELRLPPRKLDRAMYVKVNAVIEACGGKWNRRRGSHVLGEGSADMIQAALLTGEYHRVKQDFGQFYTPADVAIIAAAAAEIQRSHHVLEPSAGQGALAKLAAQLGAFVDCVEVDMSNVKLLKEQRLYRDVICRDFLAVEAKPIYDVVLMNPPFAKKADLDHVMHALKFVKLGGRLVAIMGAGISFREDAKTAALRSLINGCGSIIPLKEGAFKESGTNVNAVLVTISVGRRF